MEYKVTFRCETCERIETGYGWECPEFESLNEAILHVLEHGNHKITLYTEDIKININLE